jgi:hypothetical protein
MEDSPLPQATTAEAAATVVTAPARGNLTVGIVLGLVVVIGGYYIGDWIVPNADLFPQIFLWLALPWLTLAGLVLVFALCGQRSTAIGLGLAGLALLILATLVIGAWLVMLSLADPAAFH